MASGTAGSFRSREEFMVSSTTFFGHMIGYWILIGLNKQKPEGYEATTHGFFPRPLNNPRVFSPPTFVLQL